MKAVHSVIFCLLGMLSTAAVAEPEFLPLAARFTETRKFADAPTQSTDWYLSRRENEVETERGSYGELWQRDTRGELSLTRYFNQERKRIQYTPGELRTQHRVKNWSTLNGIVDTHLLSSLTRKNSLRVLGRPAERYVGSLGKEKIEVVWLPQEHLAAKYTRTTRDAKFTLELKELRARPAAHWVKTNRAVTENYEFIDGADLGDMEYDPFVARVLANDGIHER